jgi:RNA polymerase sigma-70 factor (ECF subfamily)
MTLDAPIGRFEALFRAHFAAVRRYAFYRATSGVEADDVVAETFLTAWRRLDVVPRDDPLPWLLAVAANVRRNRARSARRAGALANRLPRDGVVSAPPEPFIAAPAVRAALGALSSADRELLMLVAWDGLSPAQVAVATDLKPSTVRIRLHRARRRFARHFAAAVDHMKPRAASGQYDIERKAPAT